MHLAFRIEGANFFSHGNSRHSLASKSRSQTHFHYLLHRRHGKYRSDISVLLDRKTTPHLRCVEIPRAMLSTSTCRRSSLHPILDHLLLTALDKSGC